MNAILKLTAGRMHYGWIVLATIFLSLLLSAGVRATPGVLMLPWATEYGWSRAIISLAIAVNIALFGLIGPFAAAAIQKYGVRRSVVTALSLITVSAGLSSFMNSTWQMILLWGVMIGCGTGLITLPLGAVIVNRWFVKSRGLAMGLFSASTATGQLVFLPLMASIVERYQWRPVVWLVAGVALIIIPVILFLVPERPAQVGLIPYGAPEDAPNDDGKQQQNPFVASFNALRMASKSRDFWLLSFSFFVCGASSNGYIGAHFISMCSDHGLSAVYGAGMLAAMGVLDMMGTTASGWLSDRYNSRVLLFFYYGLRGVALLFLPFAFDLKIFGLPLFALIFGADWVATVPPTVRLVGDIFGKPSTPIIFAWTLAAHQLGAAGAALGAGIIRSTLGSYTVATLISGSLCIITALLVLKINNRPANSEHVRQVPAPAQG